MSSAPGAVLILVCPTCGKKYRGNPAKPDGRYQCPDDQALLTKFDASQAPIPAPTPASANPPAPQPESTQQTTFETQREFPTTERVTPPDDGAYSGGRDPLLSSGAHEDLAPDDFARHAADAMHAM